MKLPPEDLSISSWSSTKQIGHVSVKDSGVRVVHLPTGTIVECDTERSQHMNRKRALEELYSILGEPPPKVLSPYKHDTITPGIAKAAVASVKEEI